jgi:L-lactate dehydrogenase
VGATTAYALLLSGLATELVLVDKDRARAEGHANDLRDAALFAHPIRVIAGDFADCAAADVIIITAGASQSGIGRSRLADLRESAAIVREIVQEIMQHDPSGIFVVVSNPVDVLTHAVWKWSGVSANRVLGSGTTLDTSRSRRRLAQRFGVAAENVHAYIVGEHGDSQVPVISSARIAGETRTAGFEILRAKGATNFGIGAALVRIVGTILRDERAVLTVSTLAPPSLGLGDVYLSLPAVIDRTGVARTLPTALDADERKALEASARVLERYNASLEDAIPVG